MDGNRDADRSEPAIDWTQPSPDLPHLFARISELVLRLGHHPADLVVMPRAEADRRETAAFTAGWAEAVSEHLPKVLLAYEKRIAEAYAQGRLDARGIGRPRRRGGSGGDESKVIPLPLTRLLGPPGPVAPSGERARGDRDGGQSDGEDRDRAGRDRSGGPERTPEPDGEGPRRRDEPDKPPERHQDPGILLSARELRGKKGARSVRRVLRGRGGRPIVPPLGIAPAQGRPAPGHAPPRSEQTGREVRRGRRRPDGSGAPEGPRAPDGDPAERATPQAPPEPAP
ncbi:hypothetical protein ACIBCM_19375 [Streptomyces sp. NPDC051018]|uniref:hypothetical protein n=1 Tax=Streptomyces sp. NPDC051018 TaxID=3365639 RepID=UPI00379B6D5B